MIFRRRVRVCLDDYGQTGVVIVTRRPLSRFYQSGIEVARLRLNRENADEQLADARLRAASFAAQLGDLERARVR